MTHLGIRRGLAYLALLMFALLQFANNDADVDLWGNVGFVQALPWQDGFYYQNTYSYSEPDHPWINHEWLAQWIFSRVFHLGGNPALLAIKLLMGSGLLVILYRFLSALPSRPSRFFLFFYLLLTVSILGYGYSMRPHHFTYLALAGLLWGAKRFDQYPRIFILSMFPFGIIWANLHGAFFIGMIVLLWLTLASGFRGARARDDATRREELRAFVGFAAAAGLFFMASLINPYGFHLWDFIGHSAAITRPYLTEWAPFHPIRDWGDHLDFIALVLLSVGACLYRPERLDARWTGLFILALLAALWMRRNIPLFAIAAVFTSAEVLAEGCDRHLTRLMQKMSVTLQILLLLVLLAASSAFAIAGNKQTPLEIEIDPEKFPVELVERLAAIRFSGNLLVFFDWAEYCIWKLYPESRVFMDGRFRSAYSEETIKDYLEFLRAGKHAERVLWKYPTDSALLHRDTPGLQGLKRMPGWVLVAEDQLAVFMVQTDVHDAVELGRQLAEAPSPLNRYFP